MTSRIDPKAPCGGSEGLRTGPLAPTSALTSQGVYDARKYLAPAWACTVCREVYITEDEAYECCSGVEGTEAYLCPCGEVYRLTAPVSFKQHLAECRAVNP